MKWTTLSYSKLSVTKKHIAIGISLIIVIGTMGYLFSGFGGVVYGGSQSITLNTNLDSFANQSQYATIMVRCDIEYDSTIRLQNISLYVDKILVSSERIARRIFNFNLDTTKFADGYHNVSLKVMNSKNVWKTASEMIRFDNTNISLSGYSIKMPAQSVIYAKTNWSLSITDNHLKIEVFENQTYIGQYRSGTYSRILNTTQSGTLEYRFDISKNNRYIKSETFSTIIHPYPVITLEFPAQLNYNNTANFSIFSEGNVIPTYRITCPELDVMLNVTGNYSGIVNTTVIGSLNYTVGIYLANQFWQNQSRIVDVINITIPEPIFPEFTIAHPISVELFDIAYFTINRMVGSDETKYSLFENRVEVVKAANNATAQILIPSEIVRTINYTLMVVQNETFIGNYSYLINIIDPIIDIDASVPPIDLAFILNYSPIVKLNDQAWLNISINNPFYCIIYEKEQFIGNYSGNAYSIKINTTVIQVLEYSYLILSQNIIIEKGTFEIEIIELNRSLYDYSYSGIVKIHNSMQLNVKLYSDDLRLELHYFNSSETLDVFELSDQNYTLPLHTLGYITFCLDIYYKGSYCDTVYFEVSVIEEETSGGAYLSYFIAICIGLSFLEFIRRVLKKT